MDKNNNPKHNLQPLYNWIGTILSVIVVIVGATVYFTNIRHDIKTVDQDLAELRNRFDETVKQEIAKLRNGVDETVNQEIVKLRNGVDETVNQEMAKLRNGVDGTVNQEIVKLRNRVDALESLKPGDGTVTRGPKITFTNEGEWGKWSDPVYCDLEQYVCGLQQKVEENLGGGDDSAMNAVAFFCCSLP